MTEAEDKEVVVLTRDQLTRLVRNTIHGTLVELGLKANSQQSGKIYRRDMVKVIGRWKFDWAVREGHLIVYKDKDARNSKVYAKRGNWERFLKLWVNQKL